MNQLIQVQTTCPNEAEAKALAKLMVQAKLAACVQIQEITSIYEWEGEIEEEKEWRLSIKTQGTHYLHLEAFISEYHSYQTPQIISLAIVNASEAYRKWLEEATQRPN
ncbi:MAG: divalent-cation tolerance protein CutA [SAR324 cluster bacterium]|nr:divalent-cation tolerance protein CutA [SAR324 cluster bacterium]